MNWIEDGTGWRVDGVYMARCVMDGAAWRWQVGDAWDRSRYGGRTLTLEDAQEACALALRLVEIEDGNRGT